MARWKNLDMERVLRKDSKTVLFRLAGKLTGTKESYDLLEMIRDEVHDGHDSIRTLGLA